MNFKKIVNLILSICALAVTCIMPVNAKTILAQETESGSILKGAPKKLFTGAGTVDTCMIDKWEFQREDANKFHVFLHCTDIEEANGSYIFYDGTATRAVMLQMQKDKNLQPGAIWSVRFLPHHWQDRSGSKTYNTKDPILTMMRRGGMRGMQTFDDGGLTYLMTKQEYEKENGKIVNLEDRSKAEKPTSNGKGEQTSGKVGTMRDKTLSDVMESMLGQSMATIKKTMDNPDQENTVGDKTELVWRVNYGFAKSKSCAQHFYFSRGADKAVAWYHDCPQGEGNYGKISATTPVPTGTRF